MRCKCLCDSGIVSGADPAILKRGFPTQSKRGGSNYMLPFKCIDRPKKRGVPPPEPPWIRHWVCPNYIVATMSGKLRFGSDRSDLFAVLVRCYSSRGGRKRGERAICILVNAYVSCFTPNVTLCSFFPLFQNPGSASEFTHFIIYKHVIINGYYINTIYWYYIYGIQLIM